MGNLRPNGLESDSTMFLIVMQLAVVVVAMVWIKLKRGPNGARMGPNATQRAELKPPVLRSLPRPKSSATMLPLWSAKAPVTPLSSVTSDEDLVDRGFSTSVAAKTAFSMHRVAPVR